LKNREGYEFANLHPQVNVELRYAPFYYEHLTFQGYQKLYYKYYIDAVLHSWKSSELMQTWDLTNNIRSNYS